MLKSVIYHKMNNTFMLNSIDIYRFDFTHQ